MQEARQELEQPASKARVEASPGASLAQMETELSQAQTDLANAQDKLTEFDAEPKKRAERRLEIPKKMEEFGKQLLDLQKSLDAPPAENESAEIAAARKTMLRGRTAAKEKELAELKSEREATPPKTNGFRSSVRWPNARWRKKRRSSKAGRS